uniref:Uncharacterized protein n=1 Tax=Anopheles christyi TaxID=43041 RepID=A0A182K4T6_9DIPT
MNSERQHHEPSHFNSREEAPSRETFYVLKNSGALAEEDVASVGMEQNIFDVSDDISYPWLPAYGEAPEANPLNTTSSRMLETIVEETSDDDDGRDKDQGGSQQPLSWSQYDHVWSSGGSDAESVIRVETPSDQDTMSERDFICPPKRRKQETSFGDEFLASDLSTIYGRRPRICEPDGLEPNEYFMKRHNEQRLRFDEIGHDLFTDSDSLSYASLSRSSSLIQFESLERQLQNETSVNQHPLSGSSPSLYTSESCTASPGGGGAYHAAGGGGDSTARGKSVPPAINGAAGSNLLTTSNLMQKSIAQTALNISDSELYSTSSSVSSTGSCSGPDSSSNASTSTGSSSSSSSSGFRYTDNRVGAVEDRLVETGRGVSGGTTTPEDAGDTEEELLSATVRCHSGRCSVERQRPSGRGIAARNKNSIESLSEDSGYCDHLQHGGNSMNSGGGGGGGGLRARSKSLTNFGSAENITFECGNVGGSGGGGGGGGLRARSKSLTNFGSAENITFECGNVGGSGGGGGGGGLRARSKSLTNFGSAENITFECGNVGGSGGGGGGGGLRARSKSLTNFGSAENITFECGNVGGSGGGGGGGGLRARSKSLTNFGSAENITFECGNVGGSGGGGGGGGLRARSKSLTNFGSAENITFECGNVGGSGGGGGGGGLRARSKSLTNFGSAENITFECGNVGGSGGGGGGGGLRARSKSLTNFGSAENITFECGNVGGSGGGGGGGGLRARSKSLTNFGSAENITFECGNVGGSGGGGGGGGLRARSKSLTNFGSAENITFECGNVGGSGGGGGGGGLRARSKSLTNFGSAENITFECGNVGGSGGGGGGMFPSTLLPVPGSLSMTQQQHEQQQPLSLDCIAMEVRHVVSSSYHENRLSTVCDVDEEEYEQEEDPKCDDGCSMDANCIVPSLTPTIIERQHAPQQQQQSQLWTNINNGTKIEHGSVSCKQRTGESRQQGAVASVTRTVTSMASSSSRSEIKNSTRLRPVLSLSAPDLLVGVVDRQRRQRRPANERTAASTASGTAVGLYDPISFTVSSVPECLNLYGGGVPANRSRHGSLDSDSVSSEFGRHAGSYGFAGACVDSVASKNFNLYDLQPRPPKCTKTVTFQTSTSNSPSRPKQNIRASYANLTALNYSDDEEDDPVYGGRRGHEYYLSRNTFRTSSGTRLGGASRSSHQIVPRTTTTLLTVPLMDHPSQRGQLAGKMDVVDVVMEEDLAEDEESTIFPVDRDEKSVFHSLLEEMSAHFDRNLSIINDQAEAYEPIAAFLHEQRTSTGSSGGARLHPGGTLKSSSKTPPQAPPRRTQIKTNPHLPQQSTAGGSPLVPATVKLVTHPVVTAVAGAETTRRRTFDQDPTNLVTCYAASLERCTFDPTESSSTSLVPSTSDLHTNGDGIALPRFVPVPVKREFVASTPNLHYYQGAVNDGEASEESRPDHHNSLRNVSTCRSTGSILATASSSRCGLSKGVSFCPIVSEIIWKSTGSSDLEPDDNGSVISNQDFEIDIDEDDFEADDLDHVNYQMENGRTASNGDRFANNRPILGEERVQRNGVPEREHTKSDGQLYPATPLQLKNRSEGELYAMIREEDGGVQHPMTLIVNDRPETTVRLNGSGVGGVGTGSVTMTPSDLTYGGDLSSAGQPNRIRMMSVGDTNGAGVLVVEDERRNNGGPNSANGNGAMASRNLIASEMRLVNSGGDSMGQLVKSGSAATMPNLYSSSNTNTTTNNNSSLIKNFKNGKAEKKGKTFLSRISSGFRFSFRNKSKKAVSGVGVLKESSSFTAPSSVNNNNNHINAKVGRGGSTSNSGNDSASADFIYIPLKDPRKQSHRSDEPPTYLQRQISAAGVTVDDSFTGAEDEPDDCEIAVTRPGGGGYYRSDSSTALNGDGGGLEQQQRGGAGAGNHVLSSKPPLPKQPPRVVGVCAKRSSASPASLKHAHAQRASSTPPRDTEQQQQDELDSTTSGTPMSYYQRRSPSQHQYAANGSYGCASYHGADTLSVDGDEDEYYYGAGGRDDGRLLVHRGSIMGSEQKIGLIETNLDTHETIISGKTRSLMELGGGQHYRGYHPLLQQQQHQQNQQTQSSSGAPVHHHQLQVHDDPAQPNGVPDHHHHHHHHSHHRQPGSADGPGRPHKSMEFLLDKENQRNVLVSLCLKQFLCFFVSTRLDQSL